MAGPGSGPGAGYGWREDQRWTTARVAVLVARRFHVRFSDAQIWRILHRMGFAGLCFEDESGQSLRSPKART
ncbi:winged helix-turn-helix domain-containing protein [Streptomyces chartreusis]|uniref:helix-turn-helix domain-containing protein n=1 Tax=Streptomyces chartreusis TaxID=1969 RepID=UPI00369C11B0